MENGPNTSGGQGNTGIRRAIVHVKGVAIGGNRHTTRKDYIVHVPATLVRFFRAENPLIAAFQTAFRTMQIKQREPQPVETAGGGLPHAVIDHQPTLGVSMGGGERPILLASHQPPRRASSINLVTAPVT